MFIQTAPPPQVYIPQHIPAEVRIAPITQEAPNWLESLAQDSFIPQQEALQPVQSSTSTTPSSPEGLLRNSGATDAIVAVGLALAVMSFMSRAVE